MNLILLNQNEIDENNTATLNGRRAKHICEILKPQPGDLLNTGIINGGIGQAEVHAISSAPAPNVTLSINPHALSARSPAPIDIEFIFALPRPKVARRLIGLCTECGVKKIHFINSYRVEKSFWQSPILSPKKINEQVLLSLEQSKDTQKPIITMHPRFKPFVEDWLPTQTHNKQTLVAHPYQADIELYGSPDKLKKLKQQPRLIAIGPEGGFIPYEIESLKKAGFNTLGLGERIYRVETVIPLLLGKLT